MTVRKVRTIMAASIAAAVLVTAACASPGEEGAGGGEVLRLWHYEAENGAAGQAWAEAMRIFQEEHPDVQLEFEKKAFDQIQNTASMVLNSDEGPDIMEYNKGNATVGLLSSQGLLTDLTDVAAERGWSDLLPESLKTTAVYDDRGVMGTGSWYGVPNYGEFVLVYYNKDIFAQHGLDVPTSLDGFEEVMQTLADAGVTPLALGGAEFPIGQVWYQLALSQADRQWVNDYQLFENPVDFHGPEATFGAEKLDEWVRNGYIAPFSAGLKNEDMALAFTGQESPIMITGSWIYGRMISEIADSFDWGIFPFPGNELTAGSSGQLWVVPETSRNKELAYDFIDITLRPEVQAILGNAGGLPVNADPQDITDAKALELVEAFDQVVKNDGLAFYPDWPVPGYGDVLVSSLQSLINQSKSPQEVLDEMAEPYESGVAQIPVE